MSQASVVYKSKAFPEASASMILFLLVVVMLGGAFFAAEHRLQTGEQVVVEGEEAPSMMRQLGLVSIGAFGVFLLAMTGSHEVRISGGLGIVLFLLGALCLCSLAWTPAFSFSLRRLGGVVLCAVCSFGICKHFKVSDFCKIVLCISLGFLGVGLLAELSGHGFAMSSVRYRFGGTVNPNLQGLYCSLIGLSSLCLFVSGIRFRPMFAALFVLAVAFLLLTGSRTSLYSFSCAVAALTWIVSTPFLRACWITGGIAVFALVVIGVELFVGGVGEQLIDVLTVGRSTDTIATLTGRAPLWAEVIHSISERPLLGYGFQGYWAGDRMLELGDATGWAARGAHNSYLECMLSMGGIGGALFVLALLIALHRATVGFRISKDPGYGFAFSWLVFGMVHSMAEGVFAKPTLFPGMVFMTVLMLLAFQRVGSQHQPHNTVGKV